MRGYHVEKFPRSNNLGSFPITGKVPHVPSDEVVCLSSIRAFQKHVVARIRCNLKLPHRDNQSCSILYELKELLSKAFAGPKLRSRQHRPVLFENWGRNKESGWLGEGKEEDGAL